MTDTVIVLCAIIALLIAGFAAYLFWAQRKFGELEGQAEKGVKNSTLALQAYERLTLLTERLRIDNLVNRLYQSGYSARDMQQALQHNIREEYEHNITQQLYVKKEVWEGITKMKEQNMYIINQLASVMPPEATAMDLNKRLLEFSLNNPDATLNKIILDAMQYEVKKLF